MTKRNLSKAIAFVLVALHPNVDLCGQTTTQPPGDEPSCCSNPANKIQNLQVYIEQHPGLLGGDADAWVRRNTPTFMNRGLVLAVGYDILPERDVDLANCCVSFRVTYTTGAADRHIEIPIAPTFIFNSACVQPSTRVVCGTLPTVTYTYISPTTFKQEPCVWFIEVTIKDKSMQHFPCDKSIIDMIFR
jgi:hypothetical protein